MEELQNSYHELIKTESNVPHHHILPALFEEQVTNNPNHTALIFNKEQLTYSELNASANQLAHHLRQLCGNKKSVIVLCMKPSFDLLISILAILKAGSTYVPLDPDNPVSRIRFILEDTKADVILTQSSEKKLFEGINAHLWCFDKQRSELSNYSINNPVHVNQPDDLAYIIYTSGSTGVPKGVMITHNNVLYFIHWFSKALAVHHEDIFDFSSSISFDFAVANTLFPMMQGAQIVICPTETKKDPYLYMAHLAQHRVTIMKSTPGHFRNLKEAVLNEKKCLYLRYIVFGGDSLFVKDLEDWLQQFPEQIMFCEYGPTEATVATSWLKVDINNIDQFKDKIPIGRPALNTQLYILDDHLNPVPPGEIAELYIGGKGVAKGYLNRKESTEKNFIKDPFSDNSSDRLYKTGDYCHFLPDGTIEFVERKDNQVKIRGFRIQTEEIEACLMTYPGMKEVAVIAKKRDNTPTSEKQLIAYCVPQNSIELNQNRLRLYLHEHLPEYMVPSFFEILSALPLSSNGKIERQKLPEINSMITHQNVFTGTELEYTLKTIWEQALNVTNIGIEQNFFDLGGNSLAAARILTKIRSSLKKDIRLKDIYSFPTVVELAKWLEKAHPISDPDENSAHVSSDYHVIPLSELQFLFWLMRAFYPKAKILNIIDRKRFRGALDINCLNAALGCVCKHDPILGYRIHRFAPIQQGQQLPPPKIEEIDIQDLSSEQQEDALIHSLDVLQHCSWKKNNHLFRLRLFRLGDERFELQIALSHLISDEVSPGIFFSNMSNFYLASLHNKEIPIYSDRSQFKDYVVKDIHRTQNEMKKNMDFWEQYLNDIPYLYFPKEHIIKKGGSVNTCQFDISDALIEQLETFCSQHRLCLTDSLTAAASICVKPYILKNKKQLISINLVKSTRDNEEYDRAIGLFVRSDILKINLDHSSDFLALSRAVQQSITDTSPHQSCPIIVKLGCLLKKGWKNNKISNALTSGLSRIYTRFFSKYQLDYRVLRMFFRVFTASKTNCFFINVNIMNNFISNQNDKKIFALDLEPVKSHQGDRMVDKNILNIWFERNKENKALLIISGNLSAPFLESLGQDIIQFMTQVKV
ncbi:amino acid adenylation domain-containing protein [Legionella quateirensis]|uniref:Non-ribosomal peptide synthetase n=1 Tax=Legionella quateirensis TaxID=45072 RepID=A0A378KTQ5_9GAMM|nr:amino acid adenylation domain-containing protein [Legionella quateirensis]KTD51028.1 non-ribosomal peptide synthetase [Legionella quateirensis]STY17726.1 non-ribosomal peptide synthetase [Legionella quateirensis]